MSSRHRAVVTGLGQYSSLGTNVQTLWEGLVSGRSGLCPMNMPNPVGLGLGALMEGSQVESERLERALRSCILEAISDAGLSLADVANDPEVPVIVGSNFGDASRLAEHGDFLHSARVVLDELGLCGELLGLSVACASGASVLGLAHDLIKQEGADRVLVCAYDLVTPYNYQGLASMKAISPDTVRPFDKGRSGTLLGEGAAAMVVEDLAAARARGALHHGEVLGYGISNDAYHFTAPEPTGVGMCTAMRQALEESGLTVDQIGHLNAHGTGTPHNDRIETHSVRTVFGTAAERVPITSIKAALGHTMGAAGALELIATLLTIRQGTIPPTLNHQEKDPECDLDYVFHFPRKVSVRACMSNSYGLWGCNASVVVGSGERS